MLLCCVKSSQVMIGTGQGTRVLPTAGGKYFAKEKSCSGRKQA